MSRRKDQTPEERARAKEHWRNLEHHCTKSGNYAPECIDALYMAFDKENDVEWWYALITYWNN